MLTSSHFQNSPYINKYYSQNPNHNSFKSDYYKKSFNNNYNKKNDEKDNSSHHSVSNDSIINILGISLHIDDIILLLIIYFLYTENTKVDMLFIVLILLLLS